MQRCKNVTVGKYTYLFTYLAGYVIVTATSDLKQELVWKISSQRGSVVWTLHSFCAYIAQRTVRDSNDNDSNKRKNDKFNVPYVTATKTRQGRIYIIFY